MNQIILSFGTLVMCFFLSVFFTEASRRLAGKINFLDHPKGRKAHARPVPLLGGLGIYSALIVGIYLPLAIFFLFRGAIVDTWPLMEDFVAGALKKSLLIHKIFAVGLLLLITGLIDDKKGMNPYVKLLVQVLAGALMFAFGIRVTLFVPSQIFSFCVTVFWFVLMMNSFNLLDNMDGLSAGIGVCVTIIMFFISHLYGNFLVAVLCAAIAGTLTGFLVFNFHPARIFMGDAGALFLGYMIAVVMTLTTYHRSSAVAPYVAYLVPMIVLMVPLYDTFSVIVVRLFRGQSIMQGDRNHFSHRLVRLGMGVKYAVTFLYFITLTTGISALFLLWVDMTGAILVLVQAACLFGIIIILEYFAGCSVNGHAEKKD